MHEESSVDHPGGRTVLVIDDEPSFCAVVCEILSLYGFRTQQALGARHALGILKELRPDLILTDVMMPDVDGLSLLRLLRSDPSLHGIPTIVITARCEPSHLDAVMEAGADAYLKKPFSANELQEKVHQFLPS
jgi:CheY-like chemotaxis protein